MKTNRYLLLTFGVMLSLYSCKNDNEIDTPSISSYKTAEVSYMGDSIPLSVTTAGNYPLNSLKFTFFQADQRISEHLLPIKEPGIYEDKLLIPFTKDANDGAAEIQIMIKNRNFNYSTMLVPLKIQRPKFPYLILKTAYGDYRMEPVAGDPYKYAVTAQFPNTKLPAIIEAPAYGENGNSFYFGGKSIKAFASPSDSIPLQTLSASGTAYTVSFDTKSFEAEPMLKPSFAAVEFPAYVNNLAVIEINLNQNQDVHIDGISDLSAWFIDPTFLDKKNNSTYTFRAIHGKYRITADQVLKYFRIEPMNGNELADFNNTSKTGAVYVNGGIGDMTGPATDERFGIPSISSNPSRWNPEKNIAMAPMGNGIYELKLIANSTLFMSNVTSSTAGISFYKNSRTLDNGFNLTISQNLYGSPGSPLPAGGTPRFEVKSATASSNAPMLTTLSNRTLGSGKTYVFRLDTNDPTAKLTITLQDN